MSIIREHTSASLSDAWRTINIDALQEDSACNFDTNTLRPPQPEIGEDEVRQLAGQVRQLLRGGDAEGALRGCLEFPVYNGPDGAKDAHLQTITEVLQSIKASEMTPLLKSIYGTPGGPELLDVLMKYIYKGMAGSAGSGGLRSPPPQAAPSGFSQMGGRPGGTNENVGSAMSVLLSWHEKVVDVAGLGTIGRVMTDWRRV
ncbi:actin-related protein 2/3 complex subunit 5 [Colletotrichum godetiae]|uniref:Actin-related protein 2/3 complex subunit 5 n=1 Tax=Colletotrichum godetiae TaxID=1209918 RepID=A0AAJ0AFW2_9PEZI|nr:actin-related protein 2/3 complex subunit 5 [Colletotrichum godetiae]KAK1672479.1 actin-related protein 2/3 complex subunit 5 [Colletotrichum godetiae]